MPDPIPEITPTDAKQHLDLGAATFVDVRDPDAYRAARVPGALHLTNDSLAEFLGQADRARPLVVYCYKGNASKQATAFLLDQGFTSVRSLSGGFEAWRGTYPHE